MTLRGNRRIKKPPEALILIDAQPLTVIIALQLLKQHLAGQGIRSKLRPDAASEKMRGGRELARGALYLILRNPLYRGEIAYHGNIYPTEHDAIIDQPLWDQVQQRLADNQVEQEKKPVSAPPTQVCWPGCYSIPRAFS